MGMLLKETAVDGSVRTELNQRRNKRTRVQGFVGDIASGNFVFAGNVEDISSGGVRLSQLPSDFSITDDSYNTVITGNDKHYRILVRPRWIKQDEATGKIEAGFKIISTSWEWEELVLNSRKNDILAGEQGYHA